MRLVLALAGLLAVWLVVRELLRVFVYRVSAATVLAVEVSGSLLIGYEHCTITVELDNGERLWRHFDFPDTDMEPTDPLAVVGRRGVVLTAPWPHRGFLWVEDHPRLRRYGALRRRIARTLGDGV